MLKDDGEGYYLALVPETTSVIGAGGLSQEVQTMLQEFSDVFQFPQGLLAKRQHNHAIVLKEGADIPNIRPYRYPHYQKNEIANIVNEMLPAGIIQHNVSPFCRLVILVRKRDGGWRFCVDYRALNKVTVADKFPIPVIEELFDELGDAKVFTKLDLKSGYQQIRMRDEDVAKTAFRTHEAH